MLITCRGNRIKLKYIYTSKSFFSVLFCFFFLWILIEEA